MSFRLFEQLSDRTLATIVGGLLPAIFYGASSVFAKASANAGMSAGGHLIFTGIAVCVVGVVLSVVMPNGGASPSAISASLMFGTLWALGSGAMVVALFRYNAVLAKLAPLYNSNTLLAVFLGLVVFSEWQQVDLIKLTLGTIAIVIGGILVSLA
ncbi:MAG: hypothetical protein ACFB9N_10670 [Geitlerinemataceae cyanobacterium]